MKRVLRLLLPPILLKLFRFIVDISSGKTGGNHLFDGDDAMFKREIKLASLIYGEYGAGASTRWVLENSDAQILAVDTSEYWVETTRQACSKYGDRAKIQFINLGEIGLWGRPKSYSHLSRFKDYTDTIWRVDQGQDSPGLVLIDGRFRVCCFLTSLKYAKSGAKIIFDDYGDRPYYHYIEKYVRPSEWCGRQALFIVPEKDHIDFQQLEDDIKLFRCVME